MASDRIAQTEEQRFHAFAISGDITRIGGGTVDGVVLDGFPVTGVPIWCPPGEAVNFQDATRGIFIPLGGDFSRLVCLPEGPKPEAGTNERVIMDPGLNFGIAFTEDGVFLIENGVRRKIAGVGQPDNNGDILVDI